MILTRFGNKKRLSEQLYRHFPKHKMRIELFFGAGGSFFHMPKPKYAILNDLDDDVTNLYLVVKKNRKQLIEELRDVPLSETLLRYWRHNNETEPIKKALRFLFLSNFSYLGKGDTMRFGLDNAKEQALKLIDPTYQALKNVKIMNRDFREVIPNICFTKCLNDKSNCFVYLDPCYLDTENNYKVPKWTKSDSTDCLDIMVNCGIKAAMSEFDHPFILESARSRGLNIQFLKNRGNIKNRRTEVLITNYKASNLLF